ncbi:unnamed protein product [Parascedosporium putredinis]|uniref:RecA family profile 1 domain-containing protein n=1 Tax=Parascedosporium putredinis TaxID=1442378 RepID=A0A9P1GZ56_9PEZI|nr:unnamed protein product [Parascedosporium putredinis]CAI7990538.1 unnamed protein product [Parascedosporium putredinis]
MTDLLHLLPDFPAGQFARLLHVLDTHGVTTTDLLTLNAADLGTRTKLPLLDLKRLSAALRAEWSAISTLDDTLDAALGGGIPAGYVTEITGESGAGKTQFLLSLLLAVQLPPPRMLAANPLLAAVDADDRPTLDNILSTVTADLESQDHILQFQVPVEVERRGVGLVVLDSVAANYRAEFERRRRRRRVVVVVVAWLQYGCEGNELVRLGAHLRELARKYNLAIVVANQVADRFSPPPALPLLFSSATPAGPPSSSAFGGLTQESPSRRARGA